MVSEQRHLSKEHYDFENKAKSWRTRFEKPGSYRTMALSFKGGGVESKSIGARPH